MKVVAINQGLCISLFIYSCIYLFPFVLIFLFIYYGDIFCDYFCNLLQAERHT